MEKRLLIGMIFSLKFLTPAKPRKIKIELIVFLWKPTNWCKNENLIPITTNDEVKYDTLEPGGVTRANIQAIIMVYLDDAFTVAWDS